MKQGFIICSSYTKELKSIAEKLKLSDIETLIVPSTCGNANREECEYFAKQRTDFEKKVGQSNLFMSQSCVGCEDVKRSNNKESFICPSFCLENFVPAQLLNYYIEKNYYITTPGWLLQWKHTLINRWKFDQETATLFFNDSAKEILVIDTGVYDNYELQLKEFSEFIHLKYTILPFGLDYFEKNIETVIYKQLQQNSSNENVKFKKEINQKISEYAMIIDLIPSLSKINSEKLVIDKIIELYTILFAPQKITYVKNNEDNEKTIVQSDYENFSIDELLSKCNTDDHCFINENQQGFITKIDFNNKIYGYIFIENILFPAYLSRYINFTQSLVPFFGLLISNSRQYEELEKLKDIAEKGKQEFQDLSEKYKSMNFDLKELNDEYESLHEEQIQNIEEITTLNENLVDKNKKLDKLNATKDKFFSIIAHDLRNPFNSILGYSELLVKNSDKYSQEKITEFSQLIYDATKNTFNLLENLLEWSKIQRETMLPKIEKIKPSEIINETILVSTQMLVAKDIDLQSNLYCDELIQADKEMLKTIIRNLLTNSIKFSYPKGQITIETQKSKMNMVFKISDQGIGIEPEHIDKLFKIDSKISKEGTAKEKGSGLGLILCKEFVEKQGGEIWVESELGLGSDFMFSLPLAKVE